MFITLKVEHLDLIMITIYDDVYNLLTVYMKSIREFNIVNLNPHAVFIFPSSSSSSFICSGGQRIKKMIE